VLYVTLEAARPTRLRILHSVTGRINKSISGVTKGRERIAGVEDQPRERGDSP
jgi:hypothetical protein